MTWWIWLIIILVALPLALLLWWLLQRQPKQEAVPEAEPEAEAPAPVAEAAVAVKEPAPPEVDDLKRVEGIGPKMSSLLREAGITTFAQLAGTDVSELERIVSEAGLRFADPATWPEQAGLAAAGDWGALEALQDELKGGRRV
jgi:predicted flap endonuclease-1-like 5' DNA nuclease